jgi:hypothetical protein
MFAGSHELTVLDQASRILAEAKSLDDIKAIRHKAEAARAYVKAAKLGLELQNRAAEVKLRRRAKGRRLAAIPQPSRRRSEIKGHDASLKLKDLGISRDQSKRWQHIACVSDAEFSKYLKNMTDQGREITSAGLLRIAGKGRTTPRPFQSSFSPEVVGTPAANRLAEELFEELMNHCRLLGDILRPIYEGAGPELKRGEKRVVGRLIGEMSVLMAQLRKTWPKSDAN